MPATYKGKQAVKLIEEWIADQPNRAPQLKVKPKTNCGQYVILFISGYNVTNTETNKFNYS